MRPANRPAKRLADRTALRPVGPAVDRLAQQLAERALKQIPNDQTEPRPGPSRPGLSEARPLPTIHQIGREELQNGNIPSPYEQRSRASALCWACDAHNPESGSCWWCAAPRWDGHVVDCFDGPGVYLVLSSVGMAKIGVSTKSAAGRAEQVCTEAARRGHTCWLLCCLPLASFPVERWLHWAFTDTRDRSWAGSVEDLPNSTEWFWPTPALEALARGEEFFDRIAPELDFSAFLPDERSAA